MSDMDIEQPSSTDDNEHKTGQKPYEITKLAISSDALSHVTNILQISCEWKECSIICSDIPTLVQHLKSDHIAPKRESYSCLWKGCSRYSVPQSSRALLLSHMKCHTGEKPFPCSHCDQTFSRSTSLQKHIKSYHEESQILEMIQYDNVKRQKKKAIVSNSEFNNPRILDVPEEHVIKVAQMLSKPNIPLLVKDNYHEIHLYFHNSEMNDQITSKDHRLNNSEKLLLARYYSEYSENRDLLFEFGELQSKQLALEKEIDLLRQTIWPCNK